MLRGLFSISSQRCSQSPSLFQSFSKLRIENKFNNSNGIKNGFNCSSSYLTKSILSQQKKWISNSSFLFMESTVTKNESLKQSINPSLEDSNDLLKEKNEGDWTETKDQELFPLVPIPQYSSPLHVLPDSFAIIHINGGQHKVTEGDVIVINRLHGPDIGQEIVLDKVLLIGTKEFTAIGTPVLENATVHAVVEEHTYSGKTLVFKKKRRKNYRRLYGHRQPITTLRILHVTLDQSKSN
eukprot:TRINITY_DN363_c0_g1_i1.p1 TRINITY_DN363_c0_g1~~TRINITY_DN363_c0_g1_i1.p1  ORF type:complete len:239 (+),score=82.01 TRINITY_DN363_c0_g1_i1:161-877(+)